MANEYSSEKISSFISAQIQSVEEVLRQDSNFDAKLKQAAQRRSHAYWVLPPEADLPEYRVDITPESGSMYIKDYTSSGGATSVLPKAQAGLTPRDRSSLYPSGCFDFESPETYDLENGLRSPQVNTPGARRGIEQLVGSIRERYLIKG